MSTIPGTFFPTLRIHFLGQTCIKYSENGSYVAIDNMKACSTIILVHGGIPRAAKAHGPILTSNMFAKVALSAYLTSTQYMADQAI